MLALEAVLMDFTGLVFLLADLVIYVALALVLP